MHGTVTNNGIPCGSGFLQEGNVIEFRTESLLSALERRHGEGILLASGIGQFAVGVAALSYGAAHGLFNVTVVGSFLVASGSLIAATRRWFFRLR